MSTPIRIAHFSDTHLGYRSGTRVDPVSGRNQRTVDVDLAFTRTIDDILTQNVDAVIHSGDVFHHSRPTWQSLRHFIRQMRRFEDAGIPVLVIAGNHDTPRIRTGGSAYSVLELALPRITFACDYIDVMFDDPFPNLDICVQAIPHGALTNPDPPLSMSPTDGKHNVMVIHGVAPGVLPDGLQAEPGEQDIPSHLLESVGYNYVALGHIHQEQQVTSTAWYSGSTERFGWGDETAKPGYSIVEFTDPTEPATVARREIETRPMIRLKPVYGNSRTGQDISTNILETLETLASPQAMTRVDLREVDRPTRREVHNLLRREAVRYVWSCDIAPERTAFIPEGDAPVADESALDLHALFSEFVAARRPNYVNQDFAAQLLDRGGRALTQALLDGETPTPEEDQLS
jgi:DNA repair exonuclease SbcCD nuclease subunit